MTVKFFKNNFINDDSIFTFTSATINLASYLYDRDYETKLFSAGSNDATPEVWEVEFDNAKDIDRLFIGLHNIRSGEVEYWTGVVWASFSTPASWSGNTDDYSYFEFNSVNTTKIRLTMNTTLVVNDEKFVAEFRALEEIGEVEEDPSKVSPLRFRKKQRLHTRSTGGNVQVIFGQKYNATFEFGEAGDNDVALFQTLNDLNESFFVYPGGGVTTISNIGFRLQDMYLVNYINDFIPNLKGNLFNIGTAIKLTFAEV